MALGRAVRGKHARHYGVVSTNSSMFGSVILNLCCVCAREDQTSEFDTEKRKIHIACTESKIGGGDDKSLARPGRKQATATILGIYSTYSPQTSIHFSACCSNFCKPLKKKYFPSNQVSEAAMASA